MAVNFLIFFYRSGPRNSCHSGKHIDSLCLPQCKVDESTNSAKIRLSHPLCCRSAWKPFRFYGLYCEQDGSCARLYGVGFHAGCVRAETGNLEHFLSIHNGNIWSDRLLQAENKWRFMWYGELSWKSYSSVCEEIGLYFSWGLKWLESSAITGQDILQWEFGVGYCGVATTDSGCFEQSMFIHSSSLDCVIFKLISLIYCVDSEITISPGSYG